MHGLTGVDRLVKSRNGNRRRNLGCLAFAGASRVVDSGNFRLSEGAVENFYFIDKTRKETTWTNKAAAHAFNPTDVDRCLIIGHRLERSVHRDGSGNLHSIFIQFEI